jgi:hypothetical protein
MKIKPARGNREKKKKKNMDMRVERRIKEGIPATERCLCFKCPCPEKLLLFSGL